MGNTAHLKFRKRITLTAFHAYLQQALMATFGDALTLDGAVTDKGSVLRNEKGVGLVQFWCESKGHISVDHRRGAVGYMVSDAMLAWLARHLNGRVFETGTGEYMDLTREYPVYFMDVVRREHQEMEDYYAKNPDPNRVPESMASMAVCHWALEQHMFAGKFARFWDHDVEDIRTKVITDMKHECQPATEEPKTIPIGEEPKPWDILACERCCLCRTKTRWWTKLPDRTPGQQVALCPGCATTATPDTIPTKQAWCDKERALEPRHPWYP